MVYVIVKGIKKFTYTKTETIFVFDYWNIIFVYVAFKN